MVVFLQADGRLISRPEGSALMVAPADAMVGRVHTQIGAHLAAGALALELEIPDLAAQAAGLRAQAVAASADADRQKQLLAEGIASRRDVEERTAAAEALQLQAAAAEALSARARVRSPLSGTVSQLLVRPGMRVAAGAPLLEVIDPSKVYASATVAAPSLAGIHAGQPAFLHLEGGTADWPAEVESVGSTVDSLSNTTQVLVRPRRYDPMLRPGLGVSIRIRVTVHRNVLVVPSEALVFVGNTPTIFVVGGDSIAHARAVVPVARGEKMVEITGDVHAGDKIVTVGAYGLPDSARVIPRAPTP
jgi:RND family efflux transporter MFP subunit